MSYEFDGSNDKIGVPAFLPPPQITLFGWGRPVTVSSLNPSLFAFGFGNFSFGDPYSFSLDTEYIPQAIGFIASTKRWRSTLAAVTPGVWQSWGVTYDRATPTTAPAMYRNGRPIGVTQTVVGSLLALASKELALGNIVASQRAVHGRVAEFVMWERVLAPPEMARAHLIGPLSVVRGCIGWWRGSRGAIARDFSGKGRTGTLTGGGPLYVADAPPRGLMP